MHFLIKFKCLTCLILERMPVNNPGLTCLYKGARATWVGSLMFWMFYASVRLIKNVVALQKIHSQVRRSPYKLALAY